MWYDEVVRNRCKHIGIFMKNNRRGGAFMEKQNLIITIGRQYGSGGAEVGKKLGQRMGWTFMTKRY